MLPFITKHKKLKINFGAKIRISNENIQQLNWWINNTEQSVKPLLRGESDMVLETDSSCLGCVILYI